MITHIVMWNFADNANGTTKEENIKKAGEMLMALPDKIDGILEFSFGKNFNGSEFAFDACLFSVFESKEALEAYQIHPEHVLVSNFISSVRTSRAVCDYEC